MNKKICIVSQSHLCRNPRVLKEALTLAQSGYEVVILTAIYSDKLLHEDLELLANTSVKYQFYSDLRRHNANSFYDRFSKKLFVALQTRLGIESKFSLGYGAKKLKVLCITHDADLYIMHQELATVTGSEMIKTHKVAFDIEDWYSEDLLPGARRVRPLKLLKWAEKTAIEKGACCYTTSYAMAKALQASYCTINEPHVIYNSFDAISGEIPVQQFNTLIRVYWISQTIGPGRGLEFFISCLTESTHSWELNVRGNISENYKAILIDLISPKDRISFLPIQKNDQILDDMVNYDFGLALEPLTPPNKNLTVSNKLFHYMAGGLPIIASNTVGQAEIALKCPDTIFLYEQNNAKALIDILNTLGQKYFNGGLNKLKNDILKFYKANFSRQAESNKLLKLINDVLRPKVSLQINLAPGDYLLARDVLPHQLKILSDQVDEVILTVDTKPSKGRFAEGWHKYKDQLDEFLTRDIKAPYNIRIVHVDYSKSVKSKVATYFFGANDIPEKDFRGGPFYAYFFGLYAAVNNFVLHLDADIFLGGGSPEWVNEAIQMFKSNSSCLIVSPLPGPPHPEDILIDQYVKLKIAPYTYSFYGMSTRVFMMDKDNFKTKKLNLTRPPALRNQLKALFDGNPNADLPERILSAFMQSHSFERIDFLGSGSGLWSLHPPYRTEAFYRQLPTLVKRIEQNDLPATQQGFYDIVDEVCDWKPAREKIENNRWWKRSFKNY